MYTLDSLILINGSYHTQHQVGQSDVDMVNMYVGIIEKSRTDDNIQVGDIVEFTNKHGDYYRNGHFERFAECGSDQWHICTQPFIPFVDLLEDEKGIVCFTSGGIWMDIPDRLRRIGKRKKMFKAWGHCGVCHDGALMFEGVVNVWEYQEPNALYGSYSTKDYNRHYISCYVEQSSNPKYGTQCHYIGDGMTFANKEEYKAWLHTFRGIEFEGNSPNQIVVFTYKQIEKLISKSEYDSLNLPVDTRICNGVISVKVEYDNIQHTVTEYRYTNSGSRWKEIKPYELARKNFMEIY